MTRIIVLSVFLFTFSLLSAQSDDKKQEEKQLFPLDLFEEDLGAMLDFAFSFSDQLLQNLPHQNENAYGPTEEDMEQLKNELRESFKELESIDMGQLQNMMKMFQDQFSEMPLEEWLQTIPKMDKTNKKDEQIRRI